MVTVRISGAVTFLYLYNYAGSSSASICVHLRIHLGGGAGFVYSSIRLFVFNDADKFVFQRGGLHLVLKVFQCAVKLQLAFVNDGEVVAEQADFAHAVRGKNDGFSRVSDSRG